MDLTKHERGKDAPMNKLDAIQLAVVAAREQRNAEIRDAFSRPDTGALWNLIFRDSAELIASIGGYAAPIDKDLRDLWIRDKMHNDPAFAAKVNATAHLILEYAQSGADYSVRNGCGEDAATMRQVTPADAPAESAESYEASAALIAARQGGAR